MNEQKQPQPQKPRTEALPIKHMRFIDSEDVPGMGMENALKGRGPDSPITVKHDIEYQPWLRRFRVAWFENAKGTTPKIVLFFPEARIRSYEEW